MVEEECTFPGHTVCQKSGLGEIVTRRCAVIRKIQIKKFFIKIQSPGGCIEENKENKELIHNFECHECGTDLCNGGPLGNGGTGNAENGAIGIKKNVNISLMMIASGLIAFGVFLLEQHVYV